MADTQNERRNRRITDNSGSDPTAIHINIQSRFPTLDDYNRVSHAYRDGYVHPNRYKVGVGACNALTRVVKSDDVVGDLIDEIDRERHHVPGPGDDPVRPGDRDPTVNIGGRMKVPDDIVAWHWTLEDSDGNVVSRAQRRANLGPDACGATLTAPDLGRYRVKLRLERTGRDLTASRPFQIRSDRLIVSVGDSYASGQGVPDQRGRANHPTWPVGALKGCPMETDPVWVEPRAHRSFQAGPALAAKEFEDTNNGDLVTYLSFASSGAEIEKGLLKKQHNWQIGGQLKEVEQTIGDRPIDALIISIGGNDIGFVPGLAAVTLLPEYTRTAVERYIQKNIRELDKKFKDLEKQIRALDPKHVLITEYPIAHFDRRDDGTVGGGCGVFNLDLIDKATPIEVRQYSRIPKITKAEAEAIKRIGRSLNQAVKDAAELHGWTLVDGMVDGFRGRGYCRSRNERYFVTVSESCTRQGDLYGTMHPNQSGHKVYASQIAAALRRELRDTGEDAGDRGRSDRGPRVRDHRENTGDQNEQDPGPRVRDHRKQSSSQSGSDREPRVRDHRENRSDRARSSDHRRDIHRK
jgi:lysophospholipase L1-like esterase